MIEQLQAELKDLVSDNELGELFRRLKEEVLRSDSDLYDKLILTEARYNKRETDSRMGVLDFEKDGISFATTNQALLWLINKIKIADLKESLRVAVDKRVHLSEALSFTCDRVTQNELVQLHYYEDPSPRIRHFYIHGDARQAVESLVQRFGNELSGSLLNWRDANYQPSQRFEFVKCKPAAAQMAKLFLINLQRELLTQFGLQPKNNIMQSKLNELLQSPALQGNFTGHPFGTDDFVFILLTIDDYNWNARVTPEVVKEFISNFCDCQLPEDAPNFFIFYGISYKKENKAVRQSVLEYIEQSSYGEKLDELHPVSRDEHIEEWFSRYDILMPTGQTAEEAAKKFFPTEERLDMMDVEAVLQRIINDHNKGLIPDH